MLHRLMRRLFLPAAFRERHGAAMEAVWREALASRTTPGARLRLWMAEAADLARTGLRLRRERRRHGHAFVARRRTTTRGGGTMQGWIDDGVHAVRALARRPTFTAFAVITVALGIGAVTAIYSTLDAVVLNPVPYDNADRMVTLMRPIGTSGAMRSPASEQVEAWAAMDDVFEAVEQSALSTMTLTGSGEPALLDVALVRPSWHAFTGRLPFLGRAFTEEEMSADARVVLLGHALWRSRFGGDPAVVGRTVDLDGEAWEVVGVMPRRSPVVHFGIQEVDLWRPLPPGPVQSPPVGVLREGVSLESALERLEAPVLLGDGTEAVGTGRGVVASLADRMRDTVTILMVAVVALLLIACVNVSNLLLGRAEGRRRETAVRSALGGGRGRLARQMMTEGLALGLLGGGVGVALTLGGLRVVHALRPPDLTTLDAVSVNGGVLVFAFGVTLAASLLFSLVPVVHASRQAAADALRAGARSVGSGALGARFRWVLVSAEVALSFALLVGSILVLGSLRGLLHQDPGFDAGRVAVLEVDLPRWRYDSVDERVTVLDDLQERLAAVPGVDDVARGVGMPGAAGVTFGTVEVAGAEPVDETFTFHGPPVGPGYFEALGQPMLRGRGFTAAEIADPEAEVVVLGEGAARRFFGDDAEVVGRRIRIGGGDSWQTVVGVTVDVPMTGLATTDRRFQMYWPNRPLYSTGASFFVRVAPGRDPAAILPEARQIVREHAGAAHIGEARPLDDVLASTVGRERFATTLLTAFAALALVLAAVGLYGVVSQLVGQRTREIGIRMALGADGLRVGRGVLLRGLGATGLGLAVGAVVAGVGLQALSSRIFGLDGGARPGAFVAAAVVLTSVAVAASWVPTRRAVRVDPTTAMRID